MSKLVVLLNDTGKEQVLQQYALEHGHDILCVFRGYCAFGIRQFLAMIDFLTNYDICEGVLIYSVEDICQLKHSNIFMWFLDKANSIGKSFCSIVPFEVNSPPSSINELDTSFLSKWRELERKIGNIYKPYPYHISINIFEERCFARCRMCYQVQNPKALVEAKMDMGLFKKIIDDIPSDAESHLIIAPGGETLCFLEVFQMIKYVSDTKPRLITDLATNGVLLDEKRGRAIIESGLKKITISINAATRDDYKWLTGIDKYGQVVKNVSNFMQLRNKLVSPAPQVLIQLRNRLADTTSRVFAQLQNKVRSSTSRVLVQLQNRLRGTTPRVMARMLGIKRFENQIENFIQQWKGVVDSVTVAPVSYCSHDPELENIESLKAPQFPIVPTCIDMMESVFIMPNGRFQLCCNPDFGDEKYGGIDLGNAKDINLFTLWQSDKYNELRKANIRGLPVMKDCLTCDVRRHEFETDLLMKSKLRKEFGLNSFL